MLDRAAPFRLAASGCDVLGCNVLGRAGLFSAALSGALSAALSGTSMEAWGGTGITILILRRRTRGWVCCGSPAIARGSGSGWKPLSSQIMARRAVSVEEFHAALAEIHALQVDDRGIPVADRARIKELVRATLLYFGQQHVGRSVEIRVPPFSAIQAFEGIRHTRGTPPNVIEMDGPIWLGLVGGRLDWAVAVESGRVRASGTKANLSPYLPMNKA